MKIIKFASNCVYIKIDGMMTFHARMGFLAGSRFEKAEQNGSAHLTEHLTNSSLLAGNDNQYDPYFFVSEINAMTFREISPAWINTTKEFRGRALETLSKYFRIQGFDDIVFKAEQKAVAGATLQWEKSSDAYEKSFDHLYEVMFGPDHALSKDPVGGSKDCNNLTESQCLEFYKNNYLGRKRSLVIYGGVDEGYLRGKIEEFGLVKKYSNNISKAISLPNYKPQTRKFAYDIETPEIISAYRIDSEAVRNTPMLELTHLILGGADQNSVMYKQLREAYNVAYDTRTHLHNFSDTALFLFYFGLQKGESSEKVIQLVKEIIGRVNKLVSEKEFEVFKIALIEKTKLHLEIPSKGTDYFTCRILTGRPIYSVEEYADCVQKLKYQDFLDTLKSEFAPERATTVILE
jgi:predicted Zn-dependent peptidase